ncbi:MULTISPECIES: ABC transporter permease [Desulfococcus]|uniref:MacB-like periplasmic core domain containing protein n=1 Tax=Desulfococcus multivorans DSM 2059 TaxID=1121405 RepID=S7TW59_DESML|nr:ABC transporter permease [Desulfococcus multivorans]AQV00508.1 MacB protein [Desulfococcus multivorans]EPR41277.1 MacB-like periplasmic core domain containing protein [Desulfococcus multivorans DSM 2059]SJZ74204.1 ABC-type transport system, involved in lipoprotein release, permease component [Desulfococcus multivorans DSM 2059]
MMFRLAWRNLWRNPRRTVVILTAVCVGVFGMIFIAALMQGVGDQMVRNSIATLVGSLQVHHRGYREDPVVENTMTDPAEPAAALAAVLPPGARWSRRVRVNAVAGNARHSAGVTLVGIEPDREGGVSFIGSAVVEGRPLGPGDPYGIIVGRALVEKFETRIGRKLVLMSQAADRDIASRAFTIVGVFRAELAATEKQFVFVSLAAAQEMLKVDKGVSEIAVLLPDGADPGPTADALKAALPERYEIHTWRELLPMLTAYIDMNEGFTVVWYLVVFIAMGFGIVNTLLMAVFERMREFGLLRALGMKPGGIVRGVLIESALLLILGTAAGNGAAFLSVAALAENGINLSAFAAGVEYAGMPRVIYPAFSWTSVLEANLTVWVLGLAVSLYPALKASGITPVAAMARV